MIERQRSVVEQFKRANEELTTVLRNGEQLYEAELERAELAERPRLRMLAEFRQGFNRTQPLALEVRRTDVELGDTMLSILKLLKLQWGQWDYDVSEGFLTFDDTETEARYWVLMERLDEIASEQSALQRELLQRQSSPLTLVGQ